LNKLFGIVLILVALAMAIVPLYTDCQSQGKSITLASGKTIPMKCHWTGRAEIALAAPLLVVGAMMVLTRRKSNLLILSILGAVLGVMAILIPDNLIGVCSTAMPCNTVMQPVLNILGGAAIAVGFGAFIISRKATE
jgi:uncharacterized membrane protein YwaF